MGATEVTNAEFARFLETHPEWRRGRLDSRRHDGDYLKLWTGERAPAELESHPVVYVTWDAANAYCQAANGRLPYEAEWERAARAGSATVFWWGDTFDASRVNAASTGTMPVGRPGHVNAFGLADMAGNVWEWTSSRDGERRVVRGGSWKDEAAFQQYSSRQLIAPETTGPDLGFRCAR
jgi:formylglycine-generating enzyme required for sulfatase activity